LAGFLLGLGLGAVASRLDPPLVATAITTAQTLGGLWLDALRMTLVPLIFSLLFVAVGQTAQTARGGGLATEALLLVGALLLIAAALSAVAASLFLQTWPTPGAVAQALRSAAPSAPSQARALPIASLVRSFVPANPVRAAADGAMAPLVVFTLIFGFAATRQTPARRAVLMDVFDAVRASMLWIVQAVLVIAPLGVFFLAFSLSARAGASLAGLFGPYLVLVSAVCIPGVVIGLGLGVAAGVRPMALVKALLPVQVIALSTQSSVASLPAMLVAVRTVGTPDRVADMVLPMAVALFRISNPAANVAIACYIAHIYGVPLDPARLAIGVVVAAVVSLAGAGVASSVTFFTTLVPVCMALNLPIVALPLLLPLEPLVDFSRTFGNTVADIGVAIWLGARGKDGEPVDTGSGGLEAEALVELSPRSAFPPA
jgi:Na+/H+-dicarboxylate symporter